MQKEYNMFHRPVLCLLFLAISKLVGNADAAETREKRQTFTPVREYHLGFPLNYQRNTGPIPSLLLMTTETTPVTFIIDVPTYGMTYHHTITAGNEVLVEFFHELQTFGNPTLEDKGVHIQVDSNNVVVIGQNLRVHRADTDGTYLALPTLDLNVTQYKYFELNMVLGAGRWPSQSLVVGTQPNTTMNITVTQPVRTIIDGVTLDLVPGTQYTYEIGYLQTFFIQHPDDLTGTKIVTNKPISLFSGRACAELPLNGGDCDYMVEQNLPTALWGTTFYVAPIPRIGAIYYFRVLAANNVTVVDIYCNNVKETHTINEGEYIHKAIDKSVNCAVYSNKEVLVVEYAGSWRTSGFPSDAAMALVPPTIYYTNYVLSSTVYYTMDLGFVHSLIVIVLEQYFNPNMIYFNSAGNSTALDTQQRIPIQANNVTRAYYTHINNISSGIFEVFHTDQTASLNTMLFGFSRPLHGGYGHAGRLEVRSATGPGGRPSVSGDPHFSIPLPSNEILCYSIQGYPGLAFNLISNDHITINALFIDSINDQSEATWISKLAVIPGRNDDGITVTFNSVDQEVEIQNQGRFKVSIIERININSHDNITVKFTKGMRKQTSNPQVHVVYSKQLAIFDVTFHSNHLDIDWLVQEKLMENSHGLMGQFMNKHITVDPIKQILIRPGFEAVPVIKEKKWQYNEEASGECWKVMNVGCQGERLIEGTILDYIVDDIKQRKFTFKN